MRYGRIISLSSCSTMWQYHTNWPALTNRIRSLVTWPGEAMTVSFHPFSQASGGVGAEPARIYSDIFE
jgi:hypothetical protein